MAKTPSPKPYPRPNTTLNQNRYHKPQPKKKKKTSIIATTKPTTRPPWSQPQPKPTTTHLPTLFSTLTKTHHPDLNPIKTVTDTHLIRPMKPTKSWPQSLTTNPWSLTESRWVSKRRQCDEKGREMMPGLRGRTRAWKGESESLWDFEGESESLRTERIRNNKILYNLATMRS